MSIRGFIGAHRIKTEHSGQHVRVEHDGQVLAESDRPLVLHEGKRPPRYYLPRADVRMDLLEASATTTHCPFKGDATYFSAPGVPDAFWTYEEPIEEVEEIAGLVAPYEGRVTVVGGVREGPGPGRGRQAARTTSSLSARCWWDGQ